MSFAPLKNREDQPVDGAPPKAVPDASRLDTSAILAGAGEVAFAWTIATDALTWDARVVDVLGVPADRIATGRGYATLFDPQNRTSRQDAILHGRALDQSAGVRYEVQYALLPDGPRGRRLIVEDVGRWYADAKGRPARVEGVVRVINERHEREQRLLFLSRYDELTGYLNRPSLLSTLADALNGAIKGQAAIAFMIIAVDNFDAINQAYGFDVADQVFACVAQRIRSTLRDGDTIGRFAGNKLGVVLRHCDDADMPSAAERFQAIAGNDLIALPGGSVAVTVSCGGVSLPRHGRTASDAVTRAQEALHIARVTGPGKFAAFNGSKELNDRRRRHAAASTEVVAALNANRFVLAHQPVVDARTRRLAFSEVSMRMERGEGAEMSAADFVMPAEGLGLVRLIDTRALDLALRALERAPQARLSLKASGETITDAADAAWLKRLAGKTTLAARLIVEIAGRAVMESAREADRFAGALHDLGCAIAVGSLGGGYPSLSGLRDLKVDFLKIDGSAIASPAASRGDQALVRALAELGRALGAKIVAERVSDDACAALLSDWGIDCLQGNLIGEAVLGDPPSPSAQD